MPCHILHHPLPLNQWSSVRQGRAILFKNSRYWALIIKLDVFKYSRSQWPLESGISTFPKFLLYIKRKSCYVHLDGYSKQLISQVLMCIQGYSCIAGGSVKCCSYFEKQCHRSSKIKHRVFCDPAVQLLDTYPRERKTYVQTKAWI